MPPKLLPPQSLKIVGMNSYADPMSLSEGFVKLIQNMKPQKISWMTREGWAKYNAVILPASSGVFGNAIYYPVATQPVELAVSNGKLYSGEAGAFTERYSGLSTSTLCSIVQSGNLAIVVDQSNKMIAYEYGKTPFELGINSPKEYKMIETFEKATDWTIVNGTAADDNVHHIQGTQCVIFLSTVAGAMTASKTLTSPLDLTVFPDTTTSSTADYISFFLIRGTYANFTNCYLSLGDAGFTAYYTIRLDTHATWTATSAPDVAFEFKIKKSEFGVGAGAPNWNSIAAVRFSAQAAGGLQAKLTLDYLRLEKTGPVATDSGVAGLLNGTYWYKITYITEDDWESDPSVMSTSVTVTNHSVNLTVIPIAGSTRIAEKRIYRIGGTSSEWRLLAILYDRTVTTYLDNIADISLGDIYIEVEGYPMIPKCITVHNESVIIANLTDVDGTKYPCGVMLSYPESIDIYDHLEMFEIEADAGGEIKWIKSTLDWIYVGKSNSIWKFDSNDLDVPPRNISRVYSGVGPLAVCEGENELYFLDPKYGVVMWNGSWFDDKFGLEVKDYIEAIPSTYLNLTWMLYFDKTVFIGVTPTGGTYPTTILACYTPLHAWYVITGWPARCGYISKASGTEILHLGHATVGHVYNAFSGDTDDGADITSIIHLANGDFGAPDSPKDYYKAFLYGNKLTATDVTLTIEPYIDGLDSTIDLDITKTILTSTIHNQLSLVIPQLGYLGVYLGLKITATKRWNFRLLSQYIRVEAPRI